MSDTREHIVLFDEYCKKCKYKIKEEYESPCNECLTEPVNTDSRKPVNFVLDTSKKNHTS